MRLIEVREATTYYRTASFDGASLVRSYTLIQEQEGSTVVESDDTTLEQSRTEI